MFIGLIIICKPHRSHDSGINILRRDIYSSRVGNFSCSGACSVLDAHFIQSYWLYLRWMYDSLDWRQDIRNFERESWNTLFVSLFNLKKCHLHILEYTYTKYIAMSWKIR